MQCRLITLYSHEKKLPNTREERNTTVTIPRDRMESPILVSRKPLQKSGQKIKVIKPILESFLWIIICYLRSQREEVLALDATHLVVLAHFFSRKCGMSPVL